MKREQDFRIFLNANHTENGTNSRISKAKNAEQILGFQLDDIIKDDEKMFKSLTELQKHENPKHNMQNVLRKYYEFERIRDFTRLKDFLKSKKIF